MQPSTGGSSLFTDPASANFDASAETDTSLPKIEAKYTFSTDMFKVGVVGGYNSYEVDTDAKDYDVDSWVAALWGQVNMGPAYVKGNVFKAVNSELLVWQVQGTMILNSWEIKSKMWIHSHMF